MWIYIQEVGQSKSKTGNDGVIISNGHLTCFNIIVMNLKTGAAMMNHVCECKHKGLSLSQVESLEIFSQIQGKKVALIIQGSRAERSPHAMQELKNRHIQTLPIMKLQSGVLCWNVEFDINNRYLIATDENQKILYEGNPFSENTVTASRVA